MEKAQAFRVVLGLAALVSFGALRPAAAEGFDCAKAFYKVDYVICRSNAGMRAIGELQAIYDQRVAAAPREQRDSLVRDEMRWINAYAAACGVGGRGVAPADPTGRTDACVVEQMRRRTAELSAYAGGPPSYSAPTAYGSQSRGTESRPPEGYAGEATQGADGLPFSPGALPPYAPSDQSAPPYFGPPGSQGASGPAQGFDCAKARLKVDYVICRSGQGMQAIRELQAAWNQVYASAPREQRHSRLRDELHWIDAYAAECGVGGKGVVPPDPTGRTDACVVDQIQRRTADLQTRASGAPPYGVQALGTDSALPPGYPVDAGQPTTPDNPLSSDAQPAASRDGSGLAQPSGGRYPIEQLRQLRGGLRPLQIDTFQGRPLFPSQDEHAFFLLVALGMKPDLIRSDQQMSSFAREFLTIDNPYQSLAGVDEFAARDKRQQFLASYANKLSGLAPRAPFEFAYRFDVDLPEYDAARRGFLLRMPSASDLRSSAVHFVGPSDWPSGFWPIDDARTLLAHLRQEQPSSGRGVRLVAIVRAVSADPEEMALDLKLVDIAVYNQSMTRKLYDFSAGGAPTPLALAPNNSLAALTNPPVGLRPWILPTLNRLPVFGSEQERGGGIGSSLSLSVLATFMGAANVPGAMERDGKRLAGVLLTDDAQSQVLSREPNRWRGESEFEKASGETLFFGKYAPLIRQAAPRPPFRFVYSFISDLPSYDKKNLGFPLSFDANGLGGLIRSGNLVPELQFSWPDVFWKLAPKDAEALFADVNRNQARYGRPGVRFAAEIEAVSLDPATTKLRLQLRSLKLYTPDLSRLVHEFPVINDAASFATGKTPRALRLPTPVVFDEIAECAEVIATLGAKSPENLIQHCIARVAARDASFYEHGGASAALAPNDARLPFFPRSGPTGSGPETVAFVAWAKSYAAGIPDTVQTMPMGPWGTEQNGDVAFPAAARASAYGQRLPDAMLQAEGLQADQIISYGMLEQVDLLMALPNRAPSYSVSVSKSALGTTQGATAQSVIRIGKPRALNSESGTPMVLMDVTPLRTVVSANGTIIATKNYQDVARLGDGFTNPAPTTPRPAPKGPIRLEAPFIDLLTASTVGDQMSRRSLAHMVLRRWALETPPSFTGSRFFVLGKRAPNPQEAASLGPEFVQWATAMTPPLPLDVVTSSPVEIQSNQIAAHWGDLTCLGGSFASLMRDVNRAMATNADLADCERHAETLTSNEHRACAAARAISRTGDYLHQVGGECLARDTSSSFTDPLSVVVRVAHDLPAPSLSLLEDRTKLIAVVTLKLTAIKLSDAPPAAADVLPESIRGPTPEPQQTDAAHEFTALDTSFLQAVYLDPRTQATVAALGPEHGGDVASIVREYDRAVEEVAKATQIPSAPYWRDIVGIRLGMSFEDAEAIVRQHMQVAKVYQGMRATDPKAHAGYPKAFTSGKLFISADEREMIALIDEPPAAPGKVLAAWRRVLIEPGTVPTEETLGALKAKYGPPTGSPATPLSALNDSVVMHPGSPINWFTPRGQRCTGYFGYGSTRPLSEFWTDNGAPVAFAGAGPYQQQNGPMIPEPFLDPLNEQARQAIECGPFLTAYYLQGQQRGGGDDTIDTMISDIDAYRDAFVRSQKMLRDAPPAPMSLFQGAYGPDVVGVRLGMTLDEARGVVEQHTKVGGVFQIARAEQSPGGAALPGSGLLFVSEGNDEVIALFDAPHPGEGHVAAIWRRVYSPQVVDLALVTRRATEKYGTPASQGDSGRLLVWGSGLPMICGASDAQAFEARTAIDARGLNDGGAFAFHAADGETNLTVPMINTLPLPAGLPTMPGAGACGPRLRVDFQPDQGDPPMNVTEITLIDPGLTDRVTQSLQAAAPRPGPVKF
jgi:uncharacterized protein YecT (DUF1311 family)